MLVTEFKMGRLNKKLSKKISVKPSAAGFSNHATKALVSMKDVLKIPTDSSTSSPAPTESFSKLVSDSVKVVKSPIHKEAQNQSATSAVINKKVLKTGKRDGKVVKLKKKERMKIRTGLLVTKLTKLESEKKEVKEKKLREKVVIVKDTKPLLDDLKEIENEISEDKKNRDLKAKLASKKPSKSTLKMKKQKNQFMKDIEFLKAASKHPDYVANPISIITTHVQNSVS